MKSETVRVRNQTAGPVGQPAVDPIERFEPSAAGRLVDDGPEIPGMKAPFARDDAFLVRRKALSLPGR
jgi:hypothetical protein